MDDDDHPLLVELSGLRQSAAHFQHEAHAAAIKLQRHAREASRIYEHAAVLEQENARLAHELDVLRAHPDVPQNHPAEAQVQELSLALRRVSDKIALTEDTLLERTSELAHARSELARSKHTLDGAYELAARMRAREEAAKARERELEFKARASEEERQMVDIVVQEYADLVRNLEGRKSVHHTLPTSNGFASATALVDTLQDGKFNLHRLLTAFSTESENLHATIAELNAKISDLQMTLDVERLSASHDRTLLSQTKTELDKLNLEDQTAAKMVARYMKFSQASTNALQEQITTLKTRHASTIATCELQLSVAESKLASEGAHSIQLQDTLDEVCDDLARESYGRRREVALRLALLSREESIAEYMRRWARRARESYARCYDLSEHDASGDAIRDAFHRVVTDAESLLSTLDDDVQFADAIRTSGSMARITQSRAAVDGLRRELQDEVHKRIEAVRKSAFLVPDGLADKSTSDIKDANASEGDGAIPPGLQTPNGNANPEHEISELPLAQGADSPAIIIETPPETIKDPFIVPIPFAPPAFEAIEHNDVQGIPSLSIQDSASTSATLLVEEELKAAPSQSPAVSILDLREDLGLGCGEKFAMPMHALPSNASILDAQVVGETDTIISTGSLSTPTTVASHPALDSPPQINVMSTLLSELGATKDRYGALQRAFRDCSLALKELKRTLASPSPSPHPHTRLRQHLETALARIDDYAEDVRVELEIRIADEELTARGFEMVLSVPGALSDADDRSEVEAGARAFVDGTDDGVARALDKFGRKLEDVQHDVAVVKQAVHGLVLSEGEDLEGRDEGRDGNVGAGWSAWTASLLGANTAPPRSPAPVETFGTVMTSPRLRHAASLKQLDGQTSGDERTPDWGPLAGLNLRIPMPVSPLHAPRAHLGLGRAVDGETRSRTLSAMYAVGGLRSSSVGLGVGLGGSPSPARRRGVSTLGMGVGMGNTSSSSRLDDTRGTGDDLGGVE